MRKVLTSAVLLLISSSAAAAGPPRPSRDFLVKSVNALTSTPTVSAARWQELSRRRPDAVLGAIASAERQGWTPTSMTALYRKTRGPAGPGVHPIAATQDLYTVSGDGEMLVWNWDDGDPNTAEGTVWVHSFVTGNEVTFNVQWAGSTYDTSDISYYEGIDSVATSAWMTGASASVPAAAPRAMFVPASLRPVQAPDNRCEMKGQSAFAGCILRAARDHLREGVRGAATGMLVGGTIGAWGAGLAGGLAGAVGGIMPGFATGVLSSLIWGTDHACRDEAWKAYYDCIYLMEQCAQHQRQDCGVPVQVAWSWKRP